MSIPMKLPITDGYHAISGHIPWEATAIHRVLTDMTADGATCSCGDYESAVEAGSYMWIEYGMDPAKSPYVIQVSGNTAKRIGKGAEKYPVLELK